MVNAGCRGAGRLTQAQIYLPECSAEVALYSVRSHCTFASQYLASQHLYRLELIDVAALLSEKYRQGLSETLRN